MLITPRPLRIVFVVAALLFAARAARAESITFEGAVSLGHAQSGAQSGSQNSNGAQGAQGAQGGQGGQSGGQSSGQSGGGQTGQVLTVDIGDVTGTVCDCGEIAPGEAGTPGGASSGGGFPRLPLLAFAAAPGLPCLFTDLCSPEPPRPPPPPPPPPPGVPEPLTILTFATGLGAFAALRRRRQHK